MVKMEQKYPLRLSALEMLLYPKSSVVIQNTLLAKAGTIELVGPQAPLVMSCRGSAAPPAP